MRRVIQAVALAALVYAGILAWQWRPLGPPEWQPAEIVEIESLSLASLPKLAQDPSNRVADDPRAARFGQALFFDPKLSATGTVACITCHQPGRNFTDGRDKGVALGTSRRNTPSIVGTAYSPWLYWDGRRDSQWSQALSPLEDANEHGGNRVAYLRYVASRDDYRGQYAELFGSLPELSDANRFPIGASPLGDADARNAWSAMAAGDREAIDLAFANLGKAIAAYERKLMHGPSRFDAYAEAVVSGDRNSQAEIFSDDEAHGLRLFLNKARCTECHNGPLFTNNEFHNNGVLSYPGDLPDEGRARGLRELVEDPFNCLGQYNDNSDAYCGELRFVREGPELLGTFRTPSLRNLAGTEPYMHRGQHKTLEEVIDHYNRAPLAMIGHNEAEFPLGMNAREMAQLKAFLLTLDGPIAADDSWLRPPGAAAASTPDRKSLANVR